MDGALSVAARGPGDPPRCLGTGEFQGFFRRVIEGAIPDDVAAKFLPAADYRGVRHLDLALRIDLIQASSYRGAVTTPRAFGRVDMIQ